MPIVKFYARLCHAKIHVLPYTVFLFCLGVETGGGGPPPTFWPKLMPKIFPFGSKPKLHAANNSPRQQKPAQISKHNFHIGASSSSFCNQIFFGRPHFVTFLPPCLFGIILRSPIRILKKLVYSSADEDRGR